MTEESVGLKLSDIWDVFPSEWRDFVISPNTHYVDPCREDLERMGVISSNDRIFSGLCGVPRYFHPRADEDTLVLSLEFIAWYFYFDDQFDDGDIGPDAWGAEIVDRMLEVLETGAVRQDSFPAERLCQRFRQHAQRVAGDSVEPWRRFIEQCKNWIWSIPPLHRSSNGIPINLAEYTALRKVNVGIIPIYALNEIVENLVLDQAFRDRPEIKRLGDLAALVIAYCNDIYSYEREAECRTQLNSIEIRRVQFKRNLSEAYLDQVNDIRKMVEEMMEIERALQNCGDLGPSSPHDDASTIERRLHQTQYVQGIKDLVIGNHLWSLSDGRYHSASSPFRELRF